jgi:hypothetical protein
MFDKKLLDNCNCQNFELLIKTKFLELESKLVKKLIFNDCEEESDFSAINKTLLEKKLENKIKAIFTKLELIEDRLGSKEEETCKCKKYIFKNTEILNDAVYRLDNLNKRMQEVMVKLKENSRDKIDGGSRPKDDIHID